MSSETERWPYRTPPELAGGPRTRAPVAIIGAGPVGLSLAIDLAQRGIAVTLLDDNDTVSVGSRAICWSKRTLEIFDRLGVGEEIVARGVTWKVGRLFHGAEEVYRFNLLPEPGHKMPAFVNLQQYTVEQLLFSRATALADRIDVRVKSEVIGHTATSEGVLLTVSTPEGRYEMEADYLVACDGARSPTRARMGLALEGQTFDETFLIADIKMEQSPFDTPEAERWFWFRPPFHDGQSALFHKQPDDIYRIDLQLGPEADVETERQAERVAPRIRAIVGEAPFELDWLSIYRFTCARLDRFLHGRVLFAGDAAHVVSPFGARGGNGGIQDADNLGWKLAAVLRGAANPDALLASYDEERCLAADENLMHSARATAFMTPKSAAERLFRDAVLDLAHTAPFARRLVNSGRLSLPATLVPSALQSPPLGSPGAGPSVGAPAPDAPILIDGRERWLLDELAARAEDLTVLSVGAAAPAVPDGVAALSVAVSGSKGAVATPLLLERYGTDGVYLVRPDQHIAACVERDDRRALEAALRRARGGWQSERQGA